MRVLVVEDEQLLADAVATGLRREAMAVDVVYDGAAALERIGVNDYDVVVLDRDLPLVHGDDVCRRIVELGMPTRVLMLKADLSGLRANYLVLAQRSPNPFDLGTLRSFRLPVSL